MSHIETSTAKLGWDDKLTCASLQAGRTKSMSWWELKYQQNKIDKFKELKGN